MLCSVYFVTNVIDRKRDAETGQRLLPAGLVLKWLVGDVDPGDYGKGSVVADLAAQDALVVFRIFGADQLICGWRVRAEPHKRVARHLCQSGLPNFYWFSRLPLVDLVGRNDGRARPVDRLVAGQRLEPRTCRCVLDLPRIVADAADRNDATILETFSFSRDG